MVREKNILRNALGTIKVGMNLKELKHCLTLSRFYIELLHNQLQAQVNVLWSDEKKQLSSLVTMNRDTKEHCTC